jgi:outer membrane biosynthesis protein TonB
MAGLQRCYKAGLAQDATLSGRVIISFTVDERGHVIDPEASGVSSSVDTCIANRMKAWRVPIAKDAKGAPTEASFTVSLALQPSS